MTEILLGVLTGQYIRKIIDRRKQKQESSKPVSVGSIYDSKSITKYPEEADKNESDSTPNK